MAITTTEAYNTNKGLVFRNGYYDHALFVDVITKKYQQKNYSCNANDDSQKSTVFVINTVAKIGNNYGKRERISST